MDSDVSVVQSQKKEPSKRAVAKKPLSTVTEISDDDVEIDISDDDDFDLEEEEPRAVAKGRKKTTNAKEAAKKPSEATKKRGPAKKTSQLGAGQKLITEVLKPTEIAVISPEKKVRRMRPSPFNKKSGSVLGRIIQQKEDENEETSGEKEDGQVSPPESSASGGSAEEITQFVVPKGRPQRVNRAKVKTYVLSDSESEKEGEEEEATDDSDFKEDGSESDH